MTDRIADRFIFGLTVSTCLYIIGHMVAYAHRLAMNAGAF